MKMRITAPATVAGNGVEVGKIVDVESGGEASRLIYYGQAVPVEDGKAVVASDKKGATK